MKFYNLRTRESVDVPENSIEKKKITRKTKSGTQTRYQLIGNYQGSKLYKFVNEETYKSMDVKEVS
ncbi:MAG: hypothetical protein IH851_06705 [Armatimonadetes bacterium]|nr:hypothetical protein [Armatimonadota bacterium]